MISPICQRRRLRPEKSDPCRAMGGRQESPSLPYVSGDTAAELLGSSVGTTARIQARGSNEQRSCTSVR